MCHALSFLILEQWGAFTPMARRKILKYQESTNWRCFKGNRLRRRLENAQLDCLGKTTIDQMGRSFLWDASARAMECSRERGPIPCHHGA